MWKVSRAGEPGFTSVFRPAKKPGDEKPVITFSKPLKSDFSGEDTDMKKILVIDDEKTTLQMMNFFLGACGYEVLTAENADSGLEIFEKELPPIVLTDIKMPGRDVFSILKMIKSIRPETEVMVVTGHGDKDLKKKAFDLEAAEFFNKPLDTDALDAALKKIEKKIGI
jgi:YesN/AraC family two-component response regulator